MCTLSTNKNEHIGAFTESYFDEADLVRIALPCHIALNILSDNRWFIVLLKVPFGTIALGANLRGLRIVDVTTWALLVTRVRGGTTTNKWWSRAVCC